MDIDKVRVLKELIESRDGSGSPIFSEEEVDSLKREILLLSIGVPAEDAKVDYRYFMFKTLNEFREACESKGYSLFLKKKS